MKMSNYIKNENMRGKPQDFPHISPGWWSISFLIVHLTANTVEFHSLVGLGGLGAKIWMMLHGKETLSEELPALNRPEFQLRRIGEGLRLENIPQKNLLV